MGQLQLHLQAAVDWKELWHGRRKGLWHGSRIRADLPAGVVSDSAAVADVLVVQDKVCKRVVAVGQDG